LDIAKIEVQHSISDYSFDVTYNGGNQIALLHNKKPVEKFDSIKVKDFLLSFKKVHLESYRTFLKPSVEDSIRKMPPAVRINVFNTKGKKETVALFSTRNVLWEGVGEIKKGYNIVDEAKAEQWLKRDHVRTATPEEVAKEYGI
jgi:hypothetical protein